MRKFHQIDFRAGRVGASLFALLVASLWLPVADSAARPARAASSACKAPRLTHMTHEVARKRAARAGCKLSLKGARLENDSVQTVGRQSPAPDRRSRVVTVWLNPLCHGSAEYAPEGAEPRVSTGPTELVSGFYLAGGPPETFSDAKCRRPAPRPYAGTVEVLDASGTVVAAQTSAEGQLARIPLTAGSYTIRGTFLSAAENGVHPVQTKSLVVPGGHTVRQDFFLSIP